MFSDMFGGVTSQEYRDYISSLGGNLLANGDGFLGNNYNFSQLTFDSSDAYSGRGSFKATGYLSVCFTNEFIAVSPDKTYELSAWVKESLNVSGARTFYGGLAFYDVDGNQIISRYYQRYSNTDTTLAAPLSVGDTTMTVTSATNWNAAGGYRTIQLFGYKNAGGTLYDRDVNPYTRLVMGTYASAAFELANVNTGTGVITLNSAFPAGAANPAGGAWPIGTKVSRGTEGGDYSYCLALGASLTTGSWTYFSGRVGSIVMDGVENTYKFPPGTARCKVILMPNFSVANSNVTLMNSIRFAPLLTPAMTSYTVSTVPNAGKMGAGCMIYVSNESGGAVPAFSDGTNWRRVTDRAVVS